MANHVLMNQHMPIASHTHRGQLLLELCIPAVLIKVRPDLLQRLQVSVAVQIERRHHADGVLVFPRLHHGAH